MQYNASIPPTGIFENYIDTQQAQGHTSEGGPLPAFLLTQQFEETPGTFDEYAYHDFARMTLADRRPDLPSFESDQPRDTSAWSRERVNLRITGSRSGSDPAAHPEIFLGFMDEDTRAPGDDHFPMFKLAQQMATRARYLRPTEHGIACDGYVASHLSEAAPTEGGVEPENETYRKLAEARRRSRAFRLFSRSIENKRPLGSAPPECVTLAERRYAIADGGAGTRARTSGFSRGLARRRTTAGLDSYPHAREYEHGYGLPSSMDELEHTDDDARDGDAIEELTTTSRGVERTEYAQGNEQKSRAHRGAVAPVAFLAPPIDRVRAIAEDERAQAAVIDVDGNASSRSVSAQCVVSAQGMRAACRARHDPHSSEMRIAPLHADGVESGIRIGGARTIPTVESLAAQMRDRVENARHDDWLRTEAVSGEVQDIAHARRRAPDDSLRLAHYSASMSDAPKTRDIMDLAMALARRKVGTMTPGTMPHVIATAGTGGAPGSEPDELRETDHWAGGPLRATYDDIARNPSYLLVDALLMKGAVAMPQMDIIRRNIVRDARAPSGAEIALATRTAMILANTGPTVGRAGHYDMDLGEDSYAAHVMPAARVASSMRKSTSRAMQDLGDHSGIAPGAVYAPLATARSGRTPHSAHGVRVAQRVVRAAREDMREQDRVARESLSHSARYHARMRGDLAESLADSDDALVSHHATSRASTNTARATRMRALDMRDDGRPRDF